MVIKKIEIRPIIGDDGKVVATEKTVKFFGIKVCWVIVYSPPTKYEESFYYAGSIEP